MLTLLISAIGLGLMISVLLIGPVFFLLIETSLTRGIRPALMLSLGVLMADVLCVLAAYFGSNQLVNIIQTHPELYAFTAFIILAYAVHMILSKAPDQGRDDDHLVTHNLFKTFINGFFLNLMNVGVIIFWILTVLPIRAAYPQDWEFWLHISVTMMTIFAVDMGKIFLAHFFKSHFTSRGIQKLRKLMGIILIIFSLVILLKALGYTKGWIGQ